MDAVDENYKMKREYNLHIFFHKKEARVMTLQRVEHHIRTTIYLRGKDMAVSRDEIRFTYLQSLSFDFSPT